MNFCFVILHYLTSKDTVDCINSILKLNSESQIVVVDNGSKNGSIEIVKNAFKDKLNIHFIENDENLGFASGNNIGYEYAKNELHSDFIAVINNDIIVDSPDFIELVYDTFVKTQFYVLGPDIESLVDHGHQNPMISDDLNIKYIKREIVRYKLLYLISKLGIYDILKKSVSNEKEKTTKNIKLDYCENVQLHGSFLVFSTRFIENEDMCFRPGTFLYLEEAILFNYCLKMHYKTVFNPNIHVYHKEDSSTSSQFNIQKEKREFVFKNMIRSLKVLENVIKHS